MIIRFLIIFFILITPSISNITDELLKLSNLYKEGLLSENEFKKAKSILLEIEEISKEQLILESKPKKKEKKLQKITKKKKKKSLNKSDVKIERIYTSEGSKYTTKNFEKMKITFGDFQIYTHRPGSVKIKKISNNKQLAVIGDRLKYKFYNNGQDYISIDTDINNKKLELIIEGRKILLWKGQYVQEAEADFYQILVLGRKPFHYYIKLKSASNAIALNMENFTRKIELAVDRVKLKLAEQYNLSVDQINKIIEEDDMMAADKFIKSDEYVEDIKLVEKKQKLYSELKASIGDDKFRSIKSGTTDVVGQTLDDAITKEIKVAIDESIRDAISSGLETAALEAAINALVDALLSGASWADAIKAGQQACASSGQSC